MSSSSSKSYGGKSYLAGEMIAAVCIIVARNVHIGFLLHLLLRVFPVAFLCQLITWRGIVRCLSPEARKGVLFFANLDHFLTNGVHEDVVTVSAIGHALKVLTIRIAKRSKVSVVKGCFGTTRIVQVGTKVSLYNFDGTVLSLFSLGAAHIQHRSKAFLVVKVETVKVETIVSILIAIGTVLAHVGGVPAAITLLTLVTHFLYISMIVAADDGGIESVNDLGRLSS
mmetsp:Transcript_7766/g.12943  ORF Transcript_7766/g.12943 Transcript_7766/m.12943 type:complete len:226 (+) Transcript_7766:80-757(+)